MADKEDDRSRRVIGGGLLLPSRQPFEHLTVLRAIFVPLTLIAGIYGMNFAFMPELQLKHGYFWVLGLMAVIAIGELWFFHKNGWFK